MSERRCANRSESAASQSSQGKKPRLELKRQRIGDRIIDCTAWRNRERCPVCRHIWLLSRKYSTIRLSRASSLPFSQGSILAPNGISIHSTSECGSGTPSSRNCGQIGIPGSGGQILGE